MKGVGEWWSEWERVGARVEGVGRRVERVRERVEGVGEWENIWRE